MRSLKMLLVAVLVFAGLSCVVGSGSSTAGATTVAGGYVPVAPDRFLDTRTGAGTSAPGAVAPFGSIAFQVAGRGDVPASIGAVALNVTVTQPSMPGYITVWGDGDPNGRPLASNLNFVSAQTVANMVISPVGSDGKVALFNGSLGTAHLIADVMGYYLPGSATDPGTLHALTPSRLLDTRDGTGRVLGPIRALSEVSLPVTGRGGIPSTGASAVVLNITVTEPTASGYITVWGDGSMPLASSLNFVPGQTVPNLVVAPVAADGTVHLFDGSPGAVHLVADVSGYFLSGAPSATSALKAVTPNRLLDTRTNAAFPPSGLDSYGTITLPVTGVAGVPASGVAAVVLNITITQPTTSGWIAAYASGTPQPPTSNVNWNAGQTIPNLVVAPVSTDGKVALTSGSPGSTHVVVDIEGYIFGAAQSGWSAQSLPTPPSQLTAVSCADQGVCGAVGVTFELATNVPVVATSVAGNWSLATAPLPSDTDRTTNAYLYSIKCPAIGTCFAVGSYTTLSGFERPLVETFASGAWSAATTQLPQDAVAPYAASLVSISCTSASSCAASGMYLGSAGHQSAFAIRLIGGAWSSPTKLAPPTGTSSDREESNFIDCAGSTCVASVATAGPGESGAYIAQLGPGGWTTTVPALPPGASKVLSLAGVSCSSATTCSIVGMYLDDSSVSGQHGLVESLVGGNWIADSINVDDDGINVFNLIEISCPTSSFCAATGIAVDDYPELIVIANGTWTATPAPLPVNAALAGLVPHISCGSAGSCVAVGYYFNFSRPKPAEPLLEVLANGTWTATAGAFPSTPPMLAAASATSCVGTTPYCVVVGSAGSAIAASPAMVETYPLN